MNKVRVIGASIAAGAALMAFPSVGHGAVTVGSNLNLDPQLAQACPGCTFVLTVPESGNTAPGGVISPVNGTVTTWRIRRGGGGSAGIAFRVVRPLGGGLYTGAGTTATVVPPDNAITPYNLPLPVQTGDLIGIDCCFGATGGFFRISGDSLQFGTFMSPSVLPNGGAGRSPDDDEGETAVQATIEPTSAFNVVSKKKRNGGKLKIRVNLPNAGELVADGKRFKETTRTASGPGELTFKLKPTKKTANLLDERNKVKAKALIEFTPTFGTTTGEQRVKAKIQD
jgi:hypothetical protein